MKTATTGAGATAGIWAALINQCGSLVYVGVYALVLQYFYATYIDSEPETAWLKIAWQRYVRWIREREHRRIGWINDTRDGAEERTFVHGS